MTVVRVDFPPEKVSAKKVSVIIMESNMSKCPICGCQCFYIKDPEDEYETFEFSVSDGRVTFSEIGNNSQPVDGQTRIHCNDCSWKGCFEDIAEN